MSAQASRIHNVYRRGDKLLYSLAIGVVIVNLPNACARLLGSVQCAWSCPEIHECWARQHVNIDCWLRSDCYTPKLLSDTWITQHMHAVGAWAVL